MPKSSNLRESYYSEDSYLVLVLNALGWVVASIGLIIAVVLISDARESVSFGLRSATTWDWRAVGAGVGIGLQGLVAGAVLMAIARILNFLAVMNARLRDETDYLEIIATEGED